MGKLHCEFDRRRRMTDGKDFLEAGGKNFVKALAAPELAKPSATTGIVPCIKLMILGPPEPCRNGDHSDTWCWRKGDRVRCRQTGVVRHACGEARSS
jgi:hypothetical protein